VDEKKSVTLKIEQKEEKLDSKQKAGQGFS